MKFRVRSGDLNIIVERLMLFEDITQELLVGVIKEAVERYKGDQMELGALMSICEYPLTSKNNCYFIESKFALKKAGFKVVEEV